MELDLGEQFVAKFENATEESWNSELLEFAEANFYNTWGYAENRSGVTHVSRMVLYRGGNVVAMAQARIFRTRWVPWGLAYVHEGPVWRKSNCADPILTLKKSLFAMKQYWAKRLRLNVVVNPPVDHVDPTGDLIVQAMLEEGFVASERGRRLVMDLRPPLEEIRRDLKPAWRNKLKNGEKGEIRIVEGVSSETFDCYADIHRQMCERKGLQNDGGLAVVTRCFGRTPVFLRPVVLIAYYGDRALAGAVITMLGKTGKHILVASANSPSEEANASWRPSSYASYVVQWHCIQMLKAQGIERYDLSSINPAGNPGTYHFKAGLCGKNGMEVSNRDFAYSPIGVVRAALKSKLVTSPRMRNRVLSILAKI